MTVTEGDLINADRHGALVIPKDVIETLEDSIEKLLSTETLILEPARSAEFNFEVFEEAWDTFEKSRT
jgi:regulator of RNase E activity RraA